MPGTWAPLWPEVEAAVRSHQPGGKLPRPNGEGWLGPLRSPLRTDANPSFSIKPDSEHDPGGWTDHATGERGSLADLAQRLGVDPRQSGGNGKRPSPSPDLAGFCKARQLDPARLAGTWGVRETLHGGRPALVYPTTVGVDRIKFLDGAKPKYRWARSGGSAHWYGLQEALRLAAAAGNGKGAALYLVNGEPSVWAATAAGVAAVCCCAGEGTRPSAALVAELVKAGFGAVRVVYDLDAEGRAGARGAVEALRAGGIEAVAVELPSVLGPGGDVDDLHRREGGELAATLAALPELPEREPGEDDDLPPQDQPAIRSVLDLVWDATNQLSLFTSPSPLRRWLLTSSGAGVLPLGKVGLLSAEGGTGKTAVMVALAVSIATRRLWMGHYYVPDAVRGRVLLLLAEEDLDDVHRRMQTVAEAYGLTPAEREVCARQIVTLPLLGHCVALTQAEGGTVAEAPLVGDLRRRLASEAGNEGWSLIGVDPLSRFAGGDVEISNEAATRFVEVLESLTRVAGHPTVLCSAHSSKTARRQGQADVRGVTGLSDAARWVGTMRRDGDHVVFAVVKSNCSLPGEPLRLRWEGSVLRALSATDQQAAVEAERASQLAEQVAEVEADVARVLEVLRREGAMGSRDGIAHAAGLRLARGRVALDLAIARGLVSPSGTARKPRYTATEGGVCVADPPYTPRTAGTASVAFGPTPSGHPGTGTGRAGTAGRADLQSAVNQARNLEHAHRATCPASTSGTSCPECDRLAAAVVDAWEAT